MTLNKKWMYTIMIYKSIITIIMGRNRYIFIERVLYDWQMCILQRSKLFSYFFFLLALRMYCEFTL